jgi:hypothetical protein
LRRLRVVDQDNGKIAMTRVVGDRVQLQKHDRQLAITNNANVAAQLAEILVEFRDDSPAFSVDSTQSFDGRQHRIQIFLVPGEQMRLH